MFSVVLPSSSCNFFSVAKNVAISSLGLKNMSLQPYAAGVDLGKQVVLQVRQAQALAGQPCG